MPKFLIDQNFDQRILRGLLRRTTPVDYFTTHQIGLSEATDPQLLDFSAKNNLIIITHDQNTFPDFASESIARGEKMSGVIIVPQEMPIGKAIDDLEIIVTCSLEDEWENVIRYLPL